MATVTAERAFSGHTTRMPVAMSAEQQDHNPMV